MSNRSPIFLLFLVLLFHFLFHIEQSSVSYNLDFSPIRNPAAERKNITILVVTGDSQKEYKFPLATVACYARRQKYDLLVVADSEYLEECRQKDRMFRRHCIAARILTRSPSTEWLLYLDADIAIANPNPIIEEYLNEEVDLIMYDRFMGWEIALGSYLAKNTRWTRNFLLDFANFEQNLPNSFHGTDNGAIHAFILKGLESSFLQRVCLKIWGESQSFDDLFLFETCVRTILGTRDRIGPIQIIPKGRGWVRDGWMTQSRWSPERDFMLHGFKASDQRIRTGFYLIDKMKELFSSRFMWYSFLEEEPHKCLWSYDEDLILSEEELNLELLSLHGMIQKRFYRSLAKLSSRL